MGSEHLHLRNEPDSAARWYLGDEAAEAALHSPAVQPDWLTTPTLRGRAVTLRPLTLDDVPALFAITPPDTFKYFLQQPREWTLDTFREYIAYGLAESNRRTFAVTLSSGELAGSSSYLDIRPAHRGLEIGFTWYAPAHRGTAVNPESKLLLLRHAFDTLGCVRVQLKCDARNLQSQRAIGKLGAVYEGTLRRHMIVSDGHIRDTVMFSITDAEWPALQERLLARLRYAGES